MSSRYMNYLRKNAKFVMVVMGIVCMITFVVGAALYGPGHQCPAGRRAIRRNPIVVTWTKGKVRSDGAGNAPLSAPVAYAVPGHRHSHGTRARR